METPIFFSLRVRRDNYSFQTSLSQRLGDSRVLSTSRFTYTVPLAEKDVDMSSIKLEDLLAMISDENLQAEISSGQPVGKEQL
jgi:hypothetical protein